MYDVSLISGLFEEGEMLCIHDDILESLKPLIDPYLAKVIQKSIDTFETSGISEQPDAIAKKLTSGFARAKRILGSRLEAMLFASKVKERGLFDVFKSYMSDNPYLGISDLDKYQSDLTWLIANRENWIAYIQPRGKKEFSTFVASCERFEVHVQTTVDSLQSLAPGLSITSVQDMGRILLRNSALFYSPNERVTPTGMQWCESHEAEIVSMCRGIDFINYRDAHNARQNDWRRLEL